MTDFKAANTMDTLITENGRTLVKHYLQDVGSTFGVANDIYQHDGSWEHFIEMDAAMKRIGTFGFALSPWATVHGHGHRAVNRKLRGRLLRSAEVENSYA